MSSATQTDGRKQAIGDIRNEIGETTRETAERGRDVGAAIVHGAREGVERVREQAADYMEKGKETASRMAATFDERVRAQPIKSLLIAAGLGLALGLCLSRRR